MKYMSLAKIPVILATTPSWWQAVSPPPAARTAEAAKGDQVKLSTLEKGFGQYVPFLSKVYKVGTVCIVYIAETDFAHAGRAYSLHDC